MNYFSSINEPCPQDKNPAEFFMTMMTEEKAGVNKKDRIAKFVDAYNSSSMAKKYLEDAPALTKFENVDIGTLKYAASWGKQFSILYKRACRNYFRSSSSTVIRYLDQIVVALIALALFYNVH